MDRIENHSELFTKIIQSMQDGFSMVDVNGICVAVNPAFCAMTGFSREELVGIGAPHPYWPVEELENIQKAFNETLNNEVKTFELIFMRKNGTRFSVLISPSPVQNNNGEIVNYFAIVKDISERKEAESKLIISENKFTKLFLSSPDSILLTELQTGMIEEVNPSFEKFSGYSRHELIGRGILELNMQRTTSEMKRFVFMLKANGSIHNEQFKVISKQGKEMWVLSSAELMEIDGVAHIITILKDISSLKSIEGELIQAKSNLKGIIECTLDNIWAIDKNYKITYLNGVFQSSYMQSLGIQLEVGMTILDYVPEAIRPTWKARYDLAMQNEFHVFEDALDIGSNIIVYFEGSMNPIIVDGEVVGVSVFVRDITPKKNYENTLKENEERLSLIFRTLSEGVALNEILYDNDGEVVDYKIIDVNNAFYHVADYNKGITPIGALASQLYGLKTEVIKQFYNNHKNEKETAHFEFYSELHDKYFQVSTSPFVDNKFVSSFDDITERKKVELSLKRSEDKYRSIFENIQDLFIQTSLDGVITEISPSVKEVLGFERDELLGKSVYKLYFNPEDRNNLVELIKKNGVVNGYKTISQNKKGELAYISINSRLITGNNGEPDYLVKSVRDITQSTNDELKIELQNRELITKNRELEQFTYITSHDLQEPLHTLISFSTLIQEELEGNINDHAKKYLDFITKSSVRMQELVKGLLDYSRLGKEKEYSLVDCNELLSDVISDMESTILNSNAHIEIKQLPTLNGYAIELRLLFQNLISNALKFTRKELVPEVVVSVKNESTMWHFVVKDNGIGIDEKDKEKIFVIFKRLHNRQDYEGIGIGLSHCKKIVELHGGAIWVESKLGEGSEFHFTIPKH